MFQSRLVPSEGIWNKPNRWWLEYPSVQKWLAAYWRQTESGSMGGNRFVCGVDHHQKSTIIHQAIVDFLVMINTIDKQISLHQPWLSFPSTWCQPPCTTARLLFLRQRHTWVLQAPESTCPFHSCTGAYMVMISLFFYCLLFTVYCFRTDWQVYLSFTIFND